MNTIFITLEHPHDLILAVRVEESGYHGAYRLLRTEYGWSDCSVIEESSEFKKISIRDLPSELTGDHGFLKIKQNIQEIYIHK